MSKDEIAERIVIDYANLSGRETANRAEFRVRVLKHLESLESEAERRGRIKEVQRLHKINSGYHGLSVRNKATKAYYYVEMKKLKDRLTQLKQDK